MKSIVIGNIAENDVRRIDTATLSSEWLGWLQASNQISDRAFFWEGDDKLVITPSPFDPLWMADMGQWLGWRNIENVCPQNTSYYISDDILADDALMTHLHERIGNAEEPVKLTSWGSTLGMNRLYENLQQAGAVYAIELLPDEDFSKNLYFDSKSGFREFCGWLGTVYPEVKIPPGAITQSAAELHQTVDEAFLAHKRPFVVKSDYRSGGSGILIFRPADIAQKSSEAVHEEIDQWLGQGDFFPPPYVVETFIPNDEQISSQLSYHGLIHPDGRVEMMGINGMLLEKEGYKGALIGDPLDPTMVAQVEKLGEIIGSNMHDHKYHGRVNIDFVVSAENELYTIETNAGRRSGSVHIYEILKVLQSQDANLTNVLTYDRFVLPTQRPLSYADVRPVFQRFSDNAPVAGCRYLPLIVSSLQNNSPYMGYMIVGPDHESVSESKVLLEEALNSSV